MIDFAKLAALSRWKQDRLKLTPPARFNMFVVSRELARLDKELIGGPGPHSDDPIIAVNRFCNVNREDDAVTKWVRTHLDHGLDKNCVPQFLAARIWNHPPTLERIMPVMSIALANSQLNELRHKGAKVMRGAYMMPVHGNNGKGRTVDEYYLAAVGEAMTVDWTKLRNLADVAVRLVEIMGIGDFLANQVCTDLRYTEAWRGSQDWYNFVLCGPGTRRGLDRYIGATKLGEGRQPDYIERLLAIREELRATDFPLSSYFWDPNNLANCFCEWDKHERVLNSETSRLHKYP